MQLMATSIWGGCLWKKCWHWSHTDKETLFPLISLWTPCHVLIGHFYKTVPTTFKTLWFIEVCNVSYSIFAQKWLGHTFSLPISQSEKWPKRVSPFLSLCWCLCALEPYLYLTDDRMLASSHPVTRQYRQTEAYCGVSCPCCVEQYYLNMWWKVGLVGWFLSWWCVR